MRGFFFFFPLLLEAGLEGILYKKDFCLSFLVVSFKKPTCLCNFDNACLSVGLSIDIHIYKFFLIVNEN